MRKVSVLDPVNSNQNSGSLLNLFDDNAYFKKTEPDSVTINSFNMQNFNLPKNEENFDDFINKMSKEQYLETIFGQALNSKQLTWVEKVRKLLLSSYMHALIIGLVLLDSLFVTIELALDSQKSESKEPETIEHLETAGEVFKYLGLSILSFFMIEITCKFIFTLKEFLSSKLELLDATIVILSFVFEIVQLTVLSKVNGLSAISKIKTSIKIITEGPKIDLST